MEAVVCRIKGQSYTCIRVAETPKAVHFIPMSSLQVEKADPRAFYTEWEEYNTYPVRRAAELYLGAGQFREIPQQAREHLTRIVANPATAFDLARALNPEPKETDMNAPAKQPATSKTGKTAPVKASAAPAKTKVAGTANGMDTVVKQVAAATKTAPAKTTPAKTTPVTKANAAPAKTAPAKTAPAPAKTAPATKANAAPAKTAPAKTAPAARPAPNADQKLKVAEPDKPRRGVTQEFVNEAVKLKTFTRQQLHDIMVKKGHESKPARIKIADCVYFKVFVEA